MVKGGRCRWLKRWGHLNRKHDEYMLMLRVNDWKLNRKTEVFHSLVPDIYAFPPFQHITLYGPFLAIRGVPPLGVCDAIESASERISGISFNLSGYLRLTGRKGQAVAHRVLPSEELVTFHTRLWDSLAGIVPSLSWIDREPSIRQFHITHAYTLRTRDADLICDTVHTCQANRENGKVQGGDGEINTVNLSVPVNNPILLPEYAPLTSLRVIVLKNGVIEREYDLPAHEWLNRQLVFNRNRTAISLMQYRKLTGLELASYPGPVEKPPFILSDLHLGHTNIIRYCRRPFNNAGEMDRVLISNWNRVVGESDQVIYLGDFRYGTESAPSSEYLGHMNGTITFIHGNHDTDLPETIPSMQVSFKGERFLFIHNPDDAPPGFTGWVVHGHYHNNDLKRYPFINAEKRRVNVSCELTGYRPVSLGKIHTMIQAYSDLNNLDIMPATDVGISKNKIPKKITRP